MATEFTSEFQKVIKIAIARKLGLPHPYDDEFDEAEFDEKLDEMSRHNKELREKDLPTIKATSDLVYQGNHFQMEVEIGDEDCF